MHAATVVAATATASIAERSPALLFTTAFIFLGSHVPMVLRGLFEVSSATADSAAPWCRHAHICHRGNGDAFDCRALCDAALHDGL